jgi:hypothetical protein
LIERSFSYDFREEGTSKLIWRIDNHCRRQHVSCRCHVHDNPDDDEHRNQFFADSRSTIFPYAMRCVHNFFENRPQEWEEAHDVEIV